ncbi:hypothetical protein ACFST9_14850 [Hymenobacter monticola]|uniref:Uncharacterized protein n=1 Tax=Hymenobacter monticola TaxID=1705399 RepID=A0ABY4B518_9BACT|nr:hypothetical protein [Hymenobacter monticola]UOE32806.1 hypothetical protein MTP16_16925 [Hymenobacter monticola]
MLPRFDTLKIAFPNLSLTTVDYTAFTAFPSNKHVDRNNYYLSAPAPGIINIRIGDTETAVEFSAKILKGRYPGLLSNATIQQALRNIIEAAPLSFDVPEVLREAHVLKAHQTHDFTLSQPFAVYAAPLAQLHVTRGYLLVEYKDESVTYIQKTTGKGREYLKIYDKGREYARPANTAYRNALTATERKTVAAYYAGKTRIETEINGKRKLRQYFPDIAPAIMLTDLLQSTSNPLATQFAEITKEAYAAIEAPAAAKSLAFADTLSYKDAPEFSFLEKHGYDLEKIDARLKALNVPSRTVTRERKKYAALLASYLAHETPSPSVANLRELKGAITIGEDAPNMADATAPPATTETAAPTIADATAVAQVTPGSTTPAITIATLAPNMADAIAVTARAITIAAHTPNMATSPFPASTPEQDAEFFALLDSLDISTAQLVEENPW